VRLGTNQLFLLHACTCGNISPYLGLNLPKTNPLLQRSSPIITIFDISEPKWQYVEIYEAEEKK